MVCSVSGGSSPRTGRRLEAGSQRRGFLPAWFLLPARYHAASQQSCTGAGSAAVTAAATASYAGSYDDGELYSRCGSIRPAGRSCTSKKRHAELLPAAVSDTKHRQTAWRPPVSAFVPAPASRRPRTVHRPAQPRRDTTTSLGRTSAPGTDPRSAHEPASTVASFHSRFVGSSCKDACFIV